MSIESIKKLIKEGDIPQARTQLREVLAKTPEDAVAQMLYGTCCQIMGDPETFGRIYQKLAPEMERCVERGEKSERISMWLKYAAMIAMIFTLGCQSSNALETESRLYTKYGGPSFDSPRPDRPHTKYGGPSFDSPRPPVRPYTKDGFRSKRILIDDDF